MTANLAETPSAYRQRLGGYRTAGALHNGHGDTDRACAGTVTSAMHRLGELGCALSHPGIKAGMTTGR